MADEIPTNEMKGKIGVPASLAGQLGDFLRREDISIEVVAGSQQAEGAVMVFECDDRKESDLNTIYSGGWIACETARALAPRLGISIEEVGKLLNQLNVKIRRCSLGCFK